MAVRSVAMFLPHLDYGGAERVAVNLAHEFVRSGLKVTCVLQNAQGGLLSELPPNVTVIGLDQKRTMSCVLPLAKLLMRDKPDILFSHLSHNNIVSIWVGLLTRTRVVVVQHNSLLMESHLHKGWQYRLLPLLYRTFMKYADGIFVVSEGLADELAQLCGIPRSRVSAMYGAEVLNVPSGHNGRLDSSGLGSKHPAAKPDYSLIWHHLRRIQKRYLPKK